MLIAEFTNSSDPYIKNIIPRTIKIIDKRVEYSFLSISSKSNEPFLNCRYIIKTNKIIETIPNI